MYFAGVTLRRIYFSILQHLYQAAREQVCYCNSKCVGERSPRIEDRCHPEIDIAFSQRLLALFTFDMVIVVFLNRCVCSTSILARLMFPVRGVSCVHGLDCYPRVALWGASVLAPCAPSHYNCIVSAQEVPPTRTHNQ